MINVLAEVARSTKIVAESSLNTLKNKGIVEIQNKVIFDQMIQNGIFIYVNKKTQSTNNESL